MAWYRLHARDLPWRNTHDPYRIWLSEIILQQTRVDQGRPYYERFTERFPTLKDLAQAQDEVVMKLWEGLGYYSRARNLLKAARLVQEAYSGRFPNTAEGLEKLPGIGPYTAAAISSFAFGQAIGVVDGNVFRLLSRLFDINACCLERFGFLHTRKRTLNTAIEGGDKLVKHFGRSHFDKCRDVRPSYLCRHP